MPQLLVLIEFFRTHAAVLTPIAGAVGAVVGYLFRYLNERRRESRKRAAAKRRLHAALRNLERHYAITTAELQSLDLLDVDAAKLQLAMQKASDARFFQVGLDDWEYYSDNLGELVLRLAMLVRNNDLHIDALVNLLDRDPQKADRARQRLLARMQGVGVLCNKVRTQAHIK